MDTVYQLTFFLALGLVAVVITIFVFAVSLLGRAMETATNSEKVIIAKRKAVNMEQMEVIKKEIEDAKANGGLPGGLTRKLNKLLKRDREFEKELSTTRKAPELLTVKGGVVHPVAFLGTALALTIIASRLSSIGISTMPDIIWGLGVAAIIYGGYRIYRTLKVVEGVAIPSEEAAFRRMIDALKRTQVELEEERKPILHLHFKDKSFPLHIKADTEEHLIMDLSLLKGDCAENVAVHICAPPGFKFSVKNTYTLGSEHDCPNYECMVWDLKRMVIPGVSYTETAIFKTPSTKGNYKIRYWVFCKGLQAPPTELEVIVE